MAAIVVIDDDKHLVDVIRQFLEAKGFSIYTAFDGIHALPLAQDHKPALIIMDVDMPTTTGLEALDQLRKDARTKNIPVILLTGVTSGRVYPVIENTPRVSHIKKPVHLEDLFSMVRHYVPENA